jgi:hypothetical protein
LYQLSSRDLLSRHSDHVDWYESFLGTDVWLTTNQQHVSPKVNLLRMRLISGFITSEFLWLPDITQDQSTDQYASY